MPVTPVKTLVVQTSENGAPVLAEPVRLVNPDGTPFTGSVESIAWSNVTGKPASFPTTWDDVSGKPTKFPSYGYDWTNLSGKPTSFPSKWADVSGKPATAAAIADLAADADAAAIVTAVNKAFAAMRTWGLIAK
ncbi:hypothetical protein JS533_005205 [Bifidobacterium amazonense]|uniref:Uncharacterized protein n=1 Tax=Bifidobacterium amazonense TaxID=2809027 RepID=A0ABS9VUA7_9BIFI|nr:hypothetical protein [Bifidobacterium amazonense]MCH9275671.1 hypothetical protein [Bifidobacterium amazonense]